MRLYSTSNATQVDDPEFGTFKAARNGAFDFPDELSARLHLIHVGKKAQWETDNERVRRISEEELESVRDPATLLAAVKDIGNGQGVLVAAIAKMLGLDPSAAAQAAASASAAPEQPADEAPASTVPTAEASAETTPHAAAEPSAHAETHQGEQPADAATPAESEHDKSGKKPGPGKK